MDLEQLAAEFRMARSVVLRLADKINDANAQAHASLIEAMGRIYNAERLLLPHYVAAADAEQDRKVASLSPRAIEQVVR